MTHLRLQIKADGRRVEGQVLDVFTDADVVRRHLAAKAHGRENQQSDPTRFPWTPMDKVFFLCVTLDGDLSPRIVKAIRSKARTYRVDWRAVVIAGSRNLSIKRKTRFTAADVEDVKQRIDVDQTIPVASVTVV